MSLVFHSILERGVAPNNVKLLLDELLQPRYVESPQLDELSQKEASAPGNTPLITSLELERLSHSFKSQAEISSMYGPRDNTALWYMFFQQISRSISEDSVICAGRHLVAPTGFLPKETTPFLMLSYAARPQNLEASSASPSEPGLSSRSSSASNKSESLASSSHEDQALQTDCGLEAAEDDPIASDGEEIVVPTSASDHVEDIRDSMDPPSSTSKSSDCSWILLLRKLEWDRHHWMSPLYTIPPITKDASPMENMTPLNLPLDAHAVAGSGPRTHVLFPIVSVALADSLLGTLFSVLHQRRAWSLELPAVCVEISQFGSVARLNAAWLDGQGNMHVIQPGAEQVGVFDLTCTQEAKFLCQALLRLRSQFVVIQDAVHSTHTITSRWRYDSQGVDSAERSWYERIQGWADTVRSEIGDDRRIPINDQSSIKANITMEQNRDNTASTAKKQSGTSRATKSTTQPARPQPKSAKASQARRSAASNNSANSLQPKPRSQAQSHISSSNFAQISSEWTFSAQEPNIQLWMAYRFAVTVPVLTISEAAPSKDREFVNRMVKEYIETTDFVWPETWSTETEMPTATRLPGAVELCKNLFSFYEKHKHSSWGQSIRSLDKALVPSLEAHLDALTMVVKGSEGRGSVGPHMNEAESRFYWDILLHAFFVDRDETSSPLVILEHFLMFPENTLAAAWKRNSTEAEDTFTSLLEEWATQCQDIYKNIVGDPNDDGFKRRKKQALEAVSKSGELKNSFLALNVDKDLNAVATALNKHVPLEPKRGRFDAFLGVPVELPELPSTLRKFRLVVYDIVNRTMAPGQSHVPSEDTDIMNNPIYAPSDLPGIAQTSSFTGIVDSAKANTPRNPPTTITKKSILMPAIVVEHKRPSHSDILPALNQVRMYCVSSVYFLHAVGIQEWPVYGLGTDGTRGVVIMACMNRATQRVYIFERNPQTVDLLNDVQTYQMATILLRVRAKHRKLLEIFNTESVQGQLMKKLKNGDSDIFEWCVEYSQTIGAAAVETGPTTAPVTVKTGDESLDPSSHENTQSMANTGNVSLNTETVDDLGKRLGGMNILGRAGSEQKPKA